MHAAREGSYPLRRFQALAAGCVLTWGLTAGALAPAHAASPPTAAMVIDANTGAVLHNQAGDAERYPASLTKMMTLYLTFELIELGRLDYTSTIKMTEEAAAQAPSKLELEPGEEISVLDAVKALVTKSANDVAVALAQHIGGSEANFARLMTQKARAIGMSKTTFKNASGLPDPDQVTTARDMLTLALRLQDDFPREYKLFATPTFTYRGHIYRNHNGLLIHYSGTDGIKTGYTRASGFNLVTSVHRGSKHLVAAVFGGRTARIRNARMRSLLDKAFAKASTKVTRTPAVAMRAPPPVRAASPARALKPSLSPPQSPPTASVVKAEPVASSPGRDTGAPAIAIARVHPVLIDHDMMRQQSPAAAQGAPAAFATASAGATTLPRFAAGLPPSTLQGQAEALAGGAPQAAPARTASLRGEEAARVPATEAGGPFEIQIGAYGDPSDAKQHMAAVRQRVGSLLDPYPAVAVPVQQGSNQFYRARFRGFDKTAAASTCVQLKRLQIDCFVTGTE